jgi:antitoxin (DNA-binding transcriptional repressor) of toxin-antitoxin stability system
MREITVSELENNLHQILQNVELNSEELSIVRDQQKIARIIPGAAQQTALEALSDLYQTLPEDAAACWIQDSRELDSILIAHMQPYENADTVRDPWDS